MTTNRQLVKRALRFTLAACGPMTNRIVSTALWTAGLDTLKARGFSPRTVFDIGVATGTDELYDAFPDATYYLVDPTRESRLHMERIASRLNARICNFALGDTEGSGRSRSGPTTSRARRSSLPRDRGALPGARAALRSGVPGIRASGVVQNRRPGIGTGRASRHRDTSRRNRRLHHRSQHDPDVAWRAGRFRNHRVLQAAWFHNLRLDGRDTPAHRQRAGADRLSVRERGFRAACGSPLARRLIRRARQLIPWYFSTANMPRCM